jgi:hypothetical protein
VLGLRLELELRLGLKLRLGEGLRLQLGLLGLQRLNLHMLGQQGLLRLQTEARCRALWIGLHLDGAGPWVQERRPDPRGGRRPGNGGR